jgi:hypothetical protein
MLLTQILGLTHGNSRDVVIEIKVTKAGYEVMDCRDVARRVSTVVVLLEKSGENEASFAKK